MPAGRLDSRVHEVVERLAESLRVVAGDGLSVAVYGSAVRSDFDAARSNIDVLVALPNASFETLTAIGPTLQAAWRNARVEPYLLKASELPRLADAFPIRVLDIQRTHVMILGADPLAGIRVDPAHLRLRVEQEARNRLLRTRRRVMSATGDPLSMAQLVRRAARTLRVEVWALLVLADHAPATADREAVFAAAREHLELDPSALAQLADIAEGGALADPVQGARMLLGVLEAIVDLADREASA